MYGIVIWQVFPLRRDVNVTETVWLTPKRPLTFKARLALLLQFQLQKRRK